MTWTRRDFLGASAGAALAWRSVAAQQPVTAAREGWLEAFRAAGFDPAAAGNSVFVVCGDVHFPQYGQHFPSQIEAWNAMRPAPQFVALLGDNVCNVSSSFGHTPDAKGLERARKELEGLRAETAKLRKEIPLKLVIGNHDTLPRETDAAFFRKVFPACRPYEAFEVSGICFQIWNGAHDGAIDPAQRVWIGKQCAGLPRDKSVVILVHQPSLGMTERERGIPAMVRAHFSEHTGPLWLLAGHVHSNSIREFALPRTRITQATHVKSVDGYWIYGMRDGRITARVYCPVAGACKAQAMPDPARPARPIPLPFEGRDDVVWRLLIGEDATATKTAFVRGKGGDCGTWWFYVNELVYKLPLASRGRGATRFAVLAALSKHRKTGELPKVYASGSDGDWIETPLLESRGAEHLFAIPEGLRKSRELYVRIQSYGYGADTCVGGFALCR